VRNSFSITSRKNVNNRKLISQASLFCLCSLQRGDLPIDFEVTDLILAREGVLGLTEPFNPSPASGIKKSEYTELSDDDKGELTATNAVISSVTWLLEPERRNTYIQLCAQKKFHACIFTYYIPGHKREHARTLCSVGVSEMIT
jgi:hypothetical protein